MRTLQADSTVRDAPGPSRSTGTLPSSYRLFVRLLGTNNLPD
ncbi:hypothetical protein STAFG_7612 [Streptomyces afghaniensis 772]|uniref:Uncharacterized protein n=1 Tax=Streptomyces afghaniensis 772 TaxID=1283301 RepID=S4MPH1_9ACTN|nr:hypothetical protein STAFG_7612 [Streptomyces afghaniensis 772]